MEELENSAVQAPEQTAPGWYAGVSLEDAELYINANLKSAARSVIAIGYYLKCVKAKELFAEAGFKDIYDYAKDRFGFSTSTTNRYMSRNDKFSINGNSPILDEKYKDFNKSQLQEMLNLDSEQLEKVTPEMSVLQIREMKKPKEIPYVAIPGQVELTDFPGIEPEDVAAATKAREEAVTSQPEKQTYTISAEDLLPAPEPQETEQSIAISQKEPEPAKQTAPESEQDSCPPGITDCRRQEWGTGSAEQEAGKKECKACWASWKRYHRALGAAAVELEPAGVLQEKTAETHQELNEVNMPSLEMCVLDFQQNHMSKRCAQAVNDRDAKVLKQELISNHGKLHNSGSTSYGFYQCDPDRIYFQDDMCETFMSLTWNGYVRELLKLLGNSECVETQDVVQESGTAVSEPNPAETVIDGEFTEIPEPEKGIQEPGESLTELQIAQEELERAKKLLNDGLKLGVDENDINIRRLKTKVCAWASYVCDLDSIVNPPPKPVQPELPVLKNNDQRKAWLRDYKSWGLWYRDENIGVSYYKYDFDNGARLIVEEYQEFSTYTGDYTSFFLHLVGGPKPPIHPSYGYEKWTHSEKYSRTINSDSELFEFLKELQQKKG